MATVVELFAQALRLHQGGDLRQAEQLYRQILQSEPDHANAHHLLGLIGFHTGHGAAASALIHKAIALRPGVAVYHSNLGLVLRSLGRTEEAIACFQRALQLNPRFADPLSHLGVVLKEAGRAEEAIATYRQALQVTPNHPEALNNLALALWDVGRRDEALRAYEEAVLHHPRYAEAHNNLGNALRELGRLDEAEASVRRALQIRPDMASAHSNLGIVLGEKGRTAEAIAVLRDAVRLQPDFAEAHHNLGLALLDAGAVNEAVASVQEALRLQPSYARAYASLGLILLEQRRLADAEASLKQAVRLRPELAEAHNTLGNVLLEAGRLEEALASFRRALEIKPDFAHAHNNLGNALKDMGGFDEALASFRQALALRPESPTFHSNLVFTLHFHPAYDARALGEANRLWAERHAAPWARQILPHANDADPERRLRIGYVSPDLRLHPVSRFLLPLLEACDRKQFEVYCYSDVLCADDFTQRLRAQADHWRDVANLTDEVLTERIRDDRIDLLVDLAAHTSRNRLLVFARKPAPVQVTYLGYCSTTGLKTIAYRLTDPYFDPPGAEAHYSEESMRLPETYWCYRPHVDTPAPAPLPALAAGRVTFGCLNNFCKASAPILTAWREILRAVPHARLLLHAHAGPHIERLRAFFAEAEIELTRIELAGYVPFLDYLHLYDRIDIGLDPFPYCGGTTTCDALWMGVPVISLAGGTAVARAGYSILSNVGLAELSASTPTEYVRRAVELAQDLPRLQELRRGLRERMLQSPLTNAPRLAGHIETAYRTMWQRWCVAPTQSPG